MISKAELKFVRGSSKKMRLVIDLVRGKDANEAIGILRFLNKRSTYYISKVLKSAVANAKVKGIDAEDLFVSKIVADEGPRWKRFRARAFGRASEILKRTSHIYIELDLKNKKQAPVAVVSQEAPKKSLAAKLMSRKKKPAAVGTATKKKTTKKKVSSK